MATTKNMDHMMSMPPENDEGDTEYKFRLICLSEKQKLHLASQLTYRLHGSNEQGQAIYDIGLTDDGFPLGLSEKEMELSLESLAEVVTMTDDAVICAVNKHEVIHHADSETELVERLMVNRSKDMNNQAENIAMKWKIVNEAKARGATEWKRWVAEVIIRKDVGEYWETRFGIAGNVDCGKSTLLGVMTSGEYDNGRGSARLAVMGHEHEISTGRTSSVSQKIVGFDQNGDLVNELIAKKSHVKGSKIEWSDIVKASSKIITFFDLAGHLKYLSQTIRGLSSNELDYVLIIVAANTSKIEDDEKARGAKMSKSFSMTKEHMEISLALGMPCVVVVTKIDSVNDDVRTKTITNLKKMIKKRFAHFTVDNINDVRTCVDLMGSGKVVPIVQVSNVTGEGHDILRKLLNFLPPRKEYESRFSSPPIMQIQDVFRKVEGTSTVIAGMLTSGEINVTEGAKQGTVMKLGPLSDGTFLTARVRSIHCKKVNVASVSAGKYICLGFPKSLDGSRLRKNMFAVGSNMKPKATWEFWADIKLAKAESTCVKPGYTPHCYIGHVRQTCKMLRIIELPKTDANGQDIEGWNTDDTSHDIASLAAGGEARVLMRFCFRPELIFDEDKKKLVFKEARTKGLGSIVKTTDTIHEPLDNKTVTKDGKQRLTRRQRKELQEIKRTEAEAQGVIIPGTRKPATKSIVTQGKMTI
jgi:GTPase